MGCFIFHKWKYKNEDGRSVRLCLKCKRKQTVSYKDRVVWYDIELNKQDIRDNQLDKLL